MTQINAWMNPLQPQPKFPVLSGELSDEVERLIGAYGTRVHPAEVPKDTRAYEFFTKGVERTPVKYDFSIRSEQRSVDDMAYHAGLKVWAAKHDLKVHTAHLRTPKYLEAIKAVLHHEDVREILQHPEGLFAFQQTIDGKTVDMVPEGIGKLTYNELKLPNIVHPFDTPEFRAKGKELAERYLN